jgi:hypothetical protein
LGDLQSGSKKIGDYAHLLLAKFESNKRTLSRTEMVLNFAVFSWTRPFRSLFKSQFEALASGLTIGDTESAMVVSIVNKTARRGDATP